jgi:hypothetical protein
VYANALAIAARGEGLAIRTAGEGLDVRLWASTAKEPGDDAA